MPLKYSYVHDLTSTWVKHSLSLVLSLVPGSLATHPPIPLVVREAKGLATRY